ncbi:MAG: GNAT family N-acetyltransferase [Tannerellaceae bacterium]|nr:GNAT family N-acetyltransferase [Tannerellaceae bacterium]
MDMVHIEKTTYYPYSLLLLADPSEEMVNGYIYSSDCLVAMVDGIVRGVVVVQKQTEESAEVMNLAVEEAFQRRGIARQLLQYVSDSWAPANGITILRVCTGTSAPGPLMLYQQEGFDLKELDRDYFVRHYPEPIFENGVQCRHRLILEKEL